jgi:peptidylprolyl isomerase domain and WD repeat-containing protein 1
VLSADERGMLEYWTPENNEQGHIEANPQFVSFKLKSETDLYDFKKNRLRPASIQFSPDFHKFVTFEFKDRVFRLFNFKTGKIIKKFDESLEQVEEQSKLDLMEFGRRLAVEREIEKSVTLNQTCNAGILFLKKCLMRRGIF